LKYFHTARRKNEVLEVVSYQLIILVRRKEKGREKTC